MAYGKNEKLLKKFLEKQEKIVYPQPNKKDTRGHRNKPQTNK
jgi:hypothetical protein